MTIQNNSTSYHCYHILLLSKVKESMVVSHLIRFSLSMTVQSFRLQVKVTSVNLTHLILGRKMKSYQGMIHINRKSLSSKATKKPLGPIRLTQSSSKVHSSQLPCGGTTENIKLPHGPTIHFSLLILIIILNLLLFFLSSISTLSLIAHQKYLPTTC